MLPRPESLSLRLLPAGLTLVGLLLTGCASAPQAPVAAPSAPPVRVQPAPPPPPPPAPPPPVAQPEPADQVARRLLAYHEQIRQLSSPELAQELTRLNAMIAANASSASPSLVLELALVLAQTHNGNDLARAVAVLDPIVRSTASELSPWQPMARLLQARIGDQRRAEEQLERQAIQLRDAQRSLQQTNEKLEALKAIERSLNARPAGPSTPASAQKAR